MSAGDSAVGFETRVELVDVRRRVGREHGPGESAFDLAKLAVVRFGISIGLSNVQLAAAPVLDFDGGAL